MSEGETVQAAYTYNADGNRATLTYANGVVESYGYNKANWITALTNAKDGETLSSYAYTYYTSGSQKSETDHTGIVTGYIYDDLGRLTQESKTGGLTVDYTYDTNGNRARMAVSGTETYTVDYTYDANNRLTAENKVQNGVSTYTARTYDNNGNLLSELDVSGAAVVSHTYDEFNRLISTVAGSTTITYTYNADGIRTARSVGSTTTEYLLDGGNVVGQVVDETTVTSYLRGVNLISDGTSYYLYNAHGDVVQLVNSSGSVTKSYDYDAFGNEKNPGEEDTNPFRYCGEYYDTETGLYYLRARYYDPALGRFTQEDTHWNTANMIYGDNPQKINEREDALGLKTYSYVPQISAIIQSGNLYVYGLSNPVLFFDRSGKWAGRVHNWVIEDIINKHPTIMFATNMKIDFINGYVSPRNVRFGMADLVNLSTGEVWEVKRASISTDRAILQLLDYIRNRLHHAEKLKAQGLCTGGSEGTYIEPASILKVEGTTSYCIIYWDAGSGIIYYDYFTNKSMPLPITSDEFETLYHAGLLFFVSPISIGGKVGLVTNSYGVR